MLRRVEWAAVLAVLLSIMAFVCAALEYETLAIVSALAGVMWAILSLKERT